eukprot:TRINITY_DN5101_c0_g1_i2.p1 TRINITY_DN5101_c0_g1~~TRINITY_DN5101_c0_g1_i2.p1  ORF type:complete len:515 (-),score=124.38 TRINITY_DN5101_c0_g1_i2:52-1596(-)
MGNDVSAEEERNITDSNYIPREMQTNTHQITLHDAFFRNNKTSQIFCNNVCVNYPETAVELLQKKDGLQCTPFHHAAAGGHEELVKLLLKKHVELGIHKSAQETVNQKIAKNATSLHVAVSCCHKDVLKVLIENGGDVNAKTESGASPLHAACYYGDSKVDGGSLEMVKLLVQSGSDINAKADGNETPIMCALGITAETESLLRGQEEIALFLLSQEGVDISGVTEETSNLLQLASSQGMDRVTAALLERHMNPNEPGPQGYPIHLATKAESVATVLALIKGGARLDVLTTQFESPLMLAVIVENLDLVKLFVSHKADINRVNDAGSVLTYASKKGHLEITKYLLEQKPDVTLKDKNGNTALHVACSRSKTNPELVKLLCDAHVNVNEKNNKGMTALHECCSYSRNGKTVQVLISEGANVNEKDLQGNTALHYLAGVKGQASTMKYMIERGAEVDGVNAEGKTPLLICVEVGSVQGVQVLMERKATCTDAIRLVAMQKGNKEIEKLLNGSGESK